MKDFRNKVAAITGAGSGMGRELALELARRGCHLSLSDVNAAGLAETAKQAAALGVKVTSATVDVANRETVFAWADATAREHGKVNLIFNNAGVAHAATAEGAPIKDFEWIMGINFWGVIHGTQAFMPHLRASGEGHVINTSSLFGLMAMPTQSTYNASKFAVRGYTEALRMELELSGAPVSATCIHPGGIATNIALAARVDGEVLSVTGRTMEQHKKLSNQMIQTTTAASAARQILRGVETNARRVVVGPDAKFLDILVRLLGSAYQVLIINRARRMKAALTSDTTGAVANGVR